MHLSKRVRAAVLATAVVGIGLAGPAAPAYANPAGCSKSINSFGQNQFRELHAAMGGSCTTSALRTLRGEIKRDLAFRPDPVVTQGSDADFQFYAIALQTCDNGNTGTYYARVFYSGFTD